MADTDIAFMSASKLAHLIRRRELSPVEAVEAAIYRKQRLISSPGNRG